MTSADLDQNDKLLAAGKKEKLEWVTPKISLMLSQDTLGKLTRQNGQIKNTPTYSLSVLDQLYLKPRHTYKNQSSERVCKDSFLESCGHLRH